MKKAKQKIAIVFCSVMLVIRPAHAGFPVLDLGESPQTFKGVANAVETLHQVKAQLRELKESLRAIGDSIQTIAEFGQSLGDMMAEIQDIADVTVGTLNSTLGVNIDLNEKLAGALSKANSLQGVVTKDLVGQVTSYVDDAARMTDKVEGTIRKAEDKAGEVVNKVGGAVALGGDIAGFSKDIGNLGEGDVLDKVNAASEKFREANGLFNGALNVAESTGLVNAEELRHKVNHLNEQQTNLVNIVNSETGNWERVDVISGDIESTLGDLKSSMDDLDKVGVNTSNMRKALDQSEGAYNDTIKIVEEVNKGAAAAQAAKGDSDSSNTEADQNKNNDVIKGENEQSEVNKSLKKDLKLNLKLKGKSIEDNQEILQNDKLIIEEEEEEVVVEEDEIDEVFTNAKEESAQIFTQINDTFDAALSDMNKGAALSQSKLTELSEALRALTEEDIDTEDKQSLEKRLDDLIDHSQKVSDWGVSIAEKAKAKYNSEYKDKIADGINNYQKVVQAYKKGTATKEDVTIAGTVLEREISEINAAPDPAIMVSYKREVEQVVEEARKLGEDIKKAVDDKQKSS